MYKGYLHEDYPFEHVEERHKDCKCECCGKPLGEGDTVYTDSKGNFCGCNNCLTDNDAETYFKEQEE